MKLSKGDYLQLVFHITFSKDVDYTPEDDEAIKEFIRRLFKSKEDGEL